MARRFGAISRSIARRAPSSNKRPVEHGSSGGPGFVGSADGEGVSALAGTISAPFAAGSNGIGITRWLRAVLSLALAIGILVIALPAAFGNGRGVGADPVQVFSSGSLLAVQTAGGAELSIDGIVPGQSRMAMVRVSNLGAVTAAFSFASHTADQVGPGGGALSKAMTLRIAVAGGGPVLYRGSLGGMSRIALGQIPAGGERAYRFTVALPGSVGNEVEGSSLSAGFTWNVA